MSEEFFPTEIHGFSIKARRNLQVSKHPHLTLITVEKGYYKVIVEQKKFIGFQSKIVFCIQRHRTKRG